ncbi:MAG: c-type cytochrome [Anaerolineae bacterium]
MKRRVLPLLAVVLVLALVLTACEALEPAPTTVAPDATATVFEEATATAPEATQPLDETPTAVAETPTAEGVTPEATPGEEVDEAQLLAMGEEVFSANCAVCHQADGQGVEGAYPALDGNQFVQSDDPAPVIQVVLNGRGAMPAFGGQLTDEEIAAAISHVRNAWTNDASVVTVDQVAEER